MRSDKYGSFDELRRAEREGVDFRIRVMRREASVAIIAPHGGKIEPGTSELTEPSRAMTTGFIASKASRSCLIATSTSRRPISASPDARNSWSRAIGSWPCMAAASGSGNLSKWEGWTRTCATLFAGSLQDAGYSAEVVTSGGLAALSPANICNRGARRRGVQLEVTRGLHDMLLAQPQGLVDFAQAVRRAIA